MFYSCAANRVRPPSNSNRPRRIRVLSSSLDLNCTRSTSTSCELCHRPHVKDHFGATVGTRRLNEREPGNIRFPSSFEERIDCPSSFEGFLRPGQSANQRRSCLFDTQAIDRKASYGRGTALTRHVTQDPAFVH